MILDNSYSYLKIFTGALEIDKSLPKWKTEKDEIKVAQRDFIIEAEEVGEDDLISNGVTISQFRDMSDRDFNIYVNAKIIDNFKHSPYNSLVELDGGAQTIISYKNPKSFIRKVNRYFRVMFGFDGKETKQEVFELDVLKFFEMVKFTTNEAKQKYIDRIEPYMIAIKNAQDMGQQALVDNLTSKLFINKYESILYANGFGKKITEDELVHFVKISEKGIDLCYIRNFTRPIPQNVIDIKKKADELLVFDNYCVLFYDDKQKSYKQLTAEEEAQVRKKKADPILFGLISGSHDLYYIADWIDEYCDLTLEEFLKVSGISEQHLQINEKIQL